MERCSCGTFEGGGDYQASKLPRLQQPSLVSLNVVAYALTYRRKERRGLETCTESGYHTQSLRRGHTPQMISAGRSPG
jgi:hypothetical protein